MNILLFIYDLHSALGRHALPPVPAVGKKSNLIGTVILSCLILFDVPIISMRNHNVVLCKFEHSD